MNQPDPIPVPTAVKPGSSPWKWLAAMGGGALLFAGGLAAGVYFTTHYRIVPLDSNAPDYRPVAESAEYAPLPATQSAPATQVAADGPFAFKFTPGERLLYNLRADIGGEGQEADIEGTSPINLAMDAQMSLATNAVDSGGTADLTLKFDQSSMQGDFMGSPFSMSTGDGKTVMRSNNKTLIDTSNNAGSTDGLPQLAFLNSSIDVKVARNGEVLDVSGYKGIEALLTQLPLTADLEFPSARLDPQTQWESTLHLPIPGFAQAAEARVMNTFLGYQTVRGRKCGVIDQRITSFQTNGQLDSPASVFGEAMGFSMPEFSLVGGSTVYFDVENGQLVRSDMDLDFSVEVGKALGESGAVVQEFLQNMITTATEDLPEFEGIYNKAKSGANLLDMKTRIKATMELEE